MHRFRKKSDARRTAPADSSHTPDTYPISPPELSWANPTSRGPVSQAQAPHQARLQAPKFLPELPSTSDFRTSLILPDLSRRFTLLRHPSGDPVSLDSLKSKFAAQRARGAEYQISEEEEDMILENLGRIRARNAGSRNLGTKDEDTDSISTNHQASASQQSFRSSSSATSAPTSPSGRPAKRYSNNLFGSGRFRDYTYLRSVTQQQQGSIDSATTNSGPAPAPAKARADTRNSIPVASSQSTSDSVSPGARSSALAAPSSHLEVSAATLIGGHRLSRNMTPAELHRTSMALEEAINEIAEEAEEEFEEAEEEIVMPRIPNPSRVLHPTSNEIESAHAAEFEAGMAMTSDSQIIPETGARGISPIPNSQPETISPTPRLPGYIPGMPRPMTPRDLDSDDQRSHSTTPRATSPNVHPTNNDRLSSGVSVIRRGSDASTTRRSSRPVATSSSSPVFAPRSTNGGFTPEDRVGARILSTDVDYMSPSAILAARRGAPSPTTAITFQPLAVSSRPGTPSNVIWNVSSNPTAQRSPGHARHGSWVSDTTAGADDLRTAHAANTPPPMLSRTRSLRSPPPVDSPTFDRQQTISPHFGSIEDHQPFTPLSRSDFGSPTTITGRLRSPTPTQSVRSPTSPAFSNQDTRTNPNSYSRRSSNHNITSASSFSLGAGHGFAFSPIPNSSRSSLESAGSSYHSWEGAGQKEPDLFTALDPQQPAWHDVSSDTSKSSSWSSDEPSKAEDVIGRYAGLTKVDFVAIQERLVKAAVAKNATPPLRDRAPSLRRRRPSTSQSNYSLNGYDNRVASPHSQSQHHGVGSTTASQHQINASKANALLESVVDSIQSPQIQSRSSPPRDVAEDLPNLEYSNSNRRNLDLAEAIFGSQEPGRKGPPTVLNLAQEVTVPSIVVDHSPDRTSATETGFSSQANDSVPLAPNHLRVRPTPLGAQSPAEQNALAEEVQRKADAATASLRRTSDNGGSQEGLRAPVPTARKRINPHQISEPKLVSSSASVDTIPLTSPGGTPVQQNLWIGDRFRKLRGTLRGKPTTTRHDEDGASYPADSRATGASPLARQHSTSMPTNAFDPGALKPSGSISAGPGFKGLLGRLRRPRMSNPPMDLDNRFTTQVHSINTSISSASQPRAETPENMDSTPTQETSAPAASRRRHPLADPDSAEDEHDHNGSATETEETVARKVFLDAALSLGLDEEAVKELLARKASTSSQAPRKTTTPMVFRPVTGNPSLRANSPKPSVGNGKANILPTPSQQSNGMERSPTPGMNGSSMDSHTPRNDEFPTVPTAKHPPSRRRADPQRADPPRTDPQRANPQEERQGNTNNAIVRRTIIFPSDAGVDLTALMRKSSQSKSRRRSSSGGSARSSRSVHDRAPTPPPPRSPSAKRFSRDSPPVPRLPPSFAAQGENMIQSPASAPATGPIEKSSSTYDSLYEMYAEETRSTSSAEADRSIYSQSIGHDQHPPTSESAPALQVIELANGEMIWSIVNGLRDDDVESAYPSRGSYASEYSTGASGSEGVQVLLKDHTRSESKSSSSSYAPARRQYQAKDRPETKVCYSSSAHIGRLIESLSQNIEAGSFNPPSSPAGRSSTSSYQASSYHSSEVGPYWTVEETLEHMLGSISSPH